jgi:hypothetical protein
MFIVKEFNSETKKQRLSLIFQLIKTQGNPFSLNESAKVVYYEDYISRMTSFTEKHIEGLLKGYQSFVKPS